MVDLSSEERIELEGGKAVVMNDAQFQGERLILRAGEYLNASGVSLRSDSAMQIGSEGMVQLNDALVASSQGVVFVSGDTIHMTDTHVEGHGGVRIKAAEDLQLVGGRLNSSDGGVRMDAGGTVAL